MRLMRALPGYVVSTNDMTGAVRGYLKEVILSVRFLSVRFSNEYLFSVTRKKLYKDVCDVVLPEPLYRAMYAGGEGKDVLKRVKRMQVAPGAKSFFFKLHTGTLSVRTFQADRGFYLPWGTNCLICKKPENIDHVFLHCWEGVYFWDVLQRTLQKELPLNSYGIRFLPIVDEEGMPFDLIMLCGLHCLWRARMAGFYRDQDARPARMYFRECMAKYVELQKTQEILPEWLSRVEPLAALREF